MEILRKWEKIEPKDNTSTFTPRTGYRNLMNNIYLRHSVAEVDGILYLFGGADSNNMTNDLYEYSISNLLITYNF